jgi:hypothetical protein
MADGGRQALPTGELALELLAAFACQRVELGVAPVLAVLPLRLDPPLLLEPMQGRIQRALLHRQHVIGQFEHALGDAPAMQGSRESVFRMSKSSVPCSKSDGFGMDDDLDA